MNAQQRVHEAISGLLDEGEMAVAWMLIIDVAGPDDRRYLAHRAGAGVDGEDAPMVWAALGMLRAGVLVAEEQLADSTTDHEDDEDDQGVG